MCCPSQDHRESPTGALAVKSEEAAGRFSATTEPQAGMIFDKDASETGGLIFGWRQFLGGRG